MTVYIPFYFRIGRGGATYVRWGRTACPASGTDLVYTGKHIYTRMFHSEHMFSFAQTFWRFGNIYIFRNFRMYWIQKSYYSFVSMTAILNVCVYHIVLCVYRFKCVKCVKLVILCMNWHYWWWNWHLWIYLLLVGCELCTYWWWYYFSRRFSYDRRKVITRQDKTR
jgi:hypothetical protein